MLTSLAMCTMSSQDSFLFYFLWSCSNGHTYTNVCLWPVCHEGCQWLTGQWLYLVLMISRKQCSKHLVNTSSYQEGRVGIPLTSLIQPFVCVCHKPGPGFPMSYMSWSPLFPWIQWVMMRGDRLIVEISGNVHHHCLNFLFHNCILLWN